LLEVYGSVGVTAVERAGLSGLNDGQKISFDVEEGQRGWTFVVNLKGHMTGDGVRR